MQVVGDFFRDIELEQIRFVSLHQKIKETRCAQDYVCCLVRIANLMFNRRPYLIKVAQYIAYLCNIFSFLTLKESNILSLEHRCEATILLSIAR